VNGENEFQVNYMTIRFTFKVRVDVWECSLLHNNEKRERERVAG
jgi:hypothetical protein